MATKRVRSLGQLRKDLDGHLAAGHATKARNTAVRMARYGKELKTGRVLAAHKRWETRKTNREQVMAQTGV